MKTFDIQRFATATPGKHVIYMYRVASQKGKEAGKRLALTTENALTITTDADSTATKDGTIRTPNPAELSLKTTAVLAQNDPMYKELKKAQISNGLIEVWETNLDDPVEGKDGTFNGTYYQGFLTEMELTSSADDYVKLTLTYGVNGTGVEGEVTVPQELLEDASYAFEDTTVAASGDSKAAESTPASGESTTGGTSEKSDSGKTE